jgi:hypothetical protein
MPCVSGQMKVVVIASVVGEIFPVDSGEVLGVPDFVEPVVTVVVEVATVLVVSADVAAVISVVDEPVGNLVVAGGGTDEPVLPIVVGPVPVLDGCPVVLDNDGVVLKVSLVK